MDGDQRARAEYDEAQLPSVLERVVAVATDRVIIGDPRITQQIRRTFVVASIVVTSMMLVLFVVGMSQSGGG